MTVTRAQERPAHTGGPTSPRPLLSIVIVSYESDGTLQPLWRSLRPDLERLESGELLLIDNASSDDSLATFRAMAQDVESLYGRRWRAEVMANPTNLGFGRACNRALALARGRYLLLLNPDTEVEPGAISRAIDYLQKHADVGMLGPRVRLPNGRLDAPCRRSFKTPGIYLYKLSGLSRLFPRSRRFGRYYLSYLDETETTDVDAVIGAFLLVRREVMEEIGAFDERFFMYCEDEDWCFRAKEAGWRVVYFPQSVVWHRKGASARKRRALMTLEWHRSVYRFHRKNMAPRYPTWLNVLVYAGMAGNLALALGKTVARVSLAQAARLGRRAWPAPMLKG